MKTTLDLPDDLLVEAKAVAAKRRTTLKAIVEHALRRELCVSEEIPSGRFERNELGFLVLKRQPGEVVTGETIRKIQDGLDEDELNRALNLAKGS